MASALNFLCLAVLGTAGGRQLDSTHGGLTVLPRIVEVQQISHYASHHVHATSPALLVDLPHSIAVQCGHRCCVGCGWCWSRHHVGHIVVSWGQAVGGKATVIVDGGICRGTDIVKAMALGADCVAIGRLTGIALAAAGTNGLIRALDLLAEECWIALGLCGVTSFAELTPKHVREAPPLGPAPHVFSAFPHLEKSIAEYKPKL